MTLDNGPSMLDVMQPKPNQSAGIFTSRALPAPQTPVLNPCAASASYSLHSLADDQSGTTRIVTSTCSLRVPTRCRTAQQRRIWCGRRHGGAFLLRLGCAGHITGSAGRCRPNLGPGPRCCWQRSSIPAGAATTAAFSRHRRRRIRDGADRTNQQMSAQVNQCCSGAVSCCCYYYFFASFNLGHHCVCYCTGTLATPPAAAAAPPAQAVLPLRVAHAHAPRQAAFSSPPPATLPAAAATPPGWVVLPLRVTLALQAAVVSGAAVLHPKQTEKSALFAARGAVQASALKVLSANPLRFELIKYCKIYQDDQGTQAPRHCHKAPAVERRRSRLATQESLALKFMTGLHHAAAHVSELFASKPRAVINHDVGYLKVTFSFRDERGNSSLHNPGPAHHTPLCSLASRLTRKSPLGVGSSTE